MKPSSDGGNRPPRLNFHNKSWLKPTLWAAGLILAFGAAAALFGEFPSVFATRAGSPQSPLSQASPTASAYVASVSPPVAGMVAAPSPPEEDEVPSAHVPYLKDPGDWPMYGHDPSRTNFNPVETILSPDNIGELVSHWQADIGAGNAPTSSAPSVANGRIYVGSSVTSGSDFFAFDAETGAEDWGDSLDPSPTTCFGVGIGSTSAISGSVVLAGGADSAYYGLDSATGTELWRDPLSEGPSGYPWASPLIVGGRAYLGVASGCDNPSVRGEVEAVDLHDGNLLASQAFVPLGKAGAGVWNSPALSPDGDTLVVATGEDFGGYNGPYNRALVALDPLSLIIRQANQQGPLDKDSDYATTPVIFHDAQGRSLVAANHKDENFYAYDLDALSQGPLWHRQTGTIVGMMPAYDPTDGNGGTLFFMDGLGALHAVDPDTGIDRWPAAPVGSARGNMAIANGMIFLNAGTGGLQVFAEKDGKRLAVYVPSGNGKTYSGVAVSHGTVYWISGHYLNAWGLP